MSLKILIIEDETAAIRRLEKMISTADETIQVIGGLDSVIGTVKWLNK